MTIVPVEQIRAQPPVSSERRALLLRHAAELSQELRKASRIARLGKTGALHRPAKYLSMARNALSWVDTRSWLSRSFIAMVVIPSLLVVLYFSLIASDQYATEARIVVRAGEVMGLDAVAAATGLASLQQAQDSLIVVDYLSSRAVVEELDKRLGLRQMFARADYLSSFDPEDSIEELVYYWRWKVRTAIEGPSGIITIGVRAFSPEDSLKITQTVVTLSEGLINDMSARAQRDVVAQSMAEVKRSEERLGRARAALRNLRNEEGILDPKLQGEAINRMIEQIRLDRLKMEQELSIVTRSLSDQAPQVQTLRSRIQAANEQIALLESQLTATNPKETRTISEALRRFEALELERQVAEKQYTTAITALERARVNAEAQKLYLNTVVRPVLATEATYPKRLWFILVGVLLFVLIWVIGLRVWSLLRARMG